MKLLIIGEDYWHPIEVFQRGLKWLAEEGHELDFVIDAKDCLTVDMLSDYDAIFVCKSNTLTAGNRSVWFEDDVTAVMPKDFADYIENGGAFIALHAGLGFTPERRPDMADIIGTNFTGHPPQCTIEMQKISDHPIMEGVNNFLFRDEHYRVECVVDDAIILFNTVSENAGTQVGGLIRERGKGRVAVMSPGHNAAVLMNPEYKKMIRNALLWCTKQL